MALVTVLSLMVVHSVVAQEDDPPYKYDPTSVSLTLYAGGEASSFGLNISISWGGVTPRAINTSMGVVSVNPADAADSFIFDFNPETFTLGIDETENVTVTVSAKPGAATGTYACRIIADDIDDGKPAIGTGSGCVVNMTVPQAPIPMLLPDGWWEYWWSTYPTLKLDVDLWSDVSSWDMSIDGMLLEDVYAASTDGRVTIHIQKGTKVLGPDGKPLDEILYTPIDPPPTPPEGYHVIAAFAFDPDGATFDPGLEITVVYDQDALTEGVDEANLVIAVRDEGIEEWEFVTGVVDPDADTVTFSIDHFTVFAMLAPALTPTPTLTQTPTPNPAAGLSAAAWTGLGVAILGGLGLFVWLIIRRQKRASA